jgi:hypothetical protein
MAAPDAAAAQAMKTVESSLVVSYADSTWQTFKPSYEARFLTGDQVPNGEGGTTLAGGPNRVTPRSHRETGEMRARQIP